MGETVKVSVSSSTGEFVSEQEQAAETAELQEQGNAPGEKFSGGMQTMVGKRPAAVQVGGRNENATGILDSARTPFGGAPSQLKGSDVVTLRDENGNKMDTSIDSAVRLGLLRRTGEGVYQEVGQQEKSSPEASLRKAEPSTEPTEGNPEGNQEENPEESEPEPVLVEFNEHQQAWVEGVQEAIGNDAFYGLVSKLTSTEDGTIDEDDVQRLADQCGVGDDPEGFVAACENIMQSYEDTYNKYIGEYVVDVNDFTKFLWRNPGRAHSLMQQYALTRDARVYNDMIQLYHRKAVHDAFVEVQQEQI